MADDEEPLADYLDRLIYSLYGATQRGYGYISRSPLHSAVIDYIEDESTGRPQPIDDAADHFLLRNFDRARQFLQHIPVPKSNGKFGFALLADGTVNEASELCGEIPWRCLHGDPGWKPCTECGHPEFLHEGDWIMCTHGKYHDEDGWLCIPCNCGNNTGR